MEEIVSTDPVQEEVQVTPEATETPQAPKRGRGRPPKIPDADVIPRKPKGGDKPPAVKEEPNVSKSAEFYGRQVEGMHLAASLMTGLDLTITPADAKTLGEAIYLVVKEYNLEFISKYAPLLNLAAVTLTVEIPVILRAQQIAAKKKAVTGEVKATAKPQGPGMEVGTPLKIVPASYGGVELGQANFS